MINAAPIPAPIPVPENTAVVGGWSAAARSGAAVNSRTISASPTSFNAFMRYISPVVMFAARPVEPARNALSMLGVQCHAEKQGRQEHEDISLEEAHKKLQQAQR